MKSSGSKTPVNNIQERDELAENDTLDGMIGFAKTVQFFEKGLNLGTAGPTATGLQHSVHNGTVGDGGRGSLMLVETRLR
jgi:hypothetical protein